MSAKDLQIPRYLCRALLPPVCQRVLTVPKPLKDIKFKINFYQDIKLTFAEAQKTVEQVNLFGTTLGTPVI